MNRVKGSRPRFRVGDWVSLLWGIRLVLAQVVEDRGPLGRRGRRLYRIVLDLREEEPRSFELAEEYLQPVSEADRAAWETEGSIALHQTMTYRGHEKNKHGDPKPLYHYLVVAKRGSQTAWIVPFSRAADDLTEGEWYSLPAKENGVDGVFATAEEYLDAQHPGLKKVLGERRP